MKPPPIRWIFQEVPVEKGIGMKKKMVLQFLMPPETNLVGSKHQWVNVPIVEAEVNEADSET